MNQWPLQTVLVLLFSTVADPDLVERLEATKGGIPAAQAEARMAQMRDVELAVVGRTYLESRRMERRPVGRVRDLGSGADG